MPENHVRAWVEVVGSVMEKFFSEFNEIPPCVKCDETKAAVWGRKEVVGTAVYNIAEFNERFVLRTVKGAALGAD